MKENYTVVVPIRYSAWLCGELGKDLKETLEKAVSGAMVTKLPRSLLVNGANMDSVKAGVIDMENAIMLKYPVFYREMGPIWTRTLQVVYESVS